MIETIAFHDPVTGQLVDSFYGRCLHFNRPTQKAAFPGPRTGANRPWSYAKFDATDPRRLEPVPS